VASSSIGGDGALRGVLGGNPVVSVSKTRTSIVCFVLLRTSKFGEKIQKNFNFLLEDNYGSNQP